MSGGSYDYVYLKIEGIEIRGDTPLRKAFQEHLKLVAAAMQAIEWVDSSDYAPGDEDEYIRKCLAHGFKPIHLLGAIKEAARDVLAAIEYIEERE